ncbi:MAG: hypothetical protein C4581_02900 [Nitrospiraceae bacterium]|nr:MAG: hypothetical protein C4581_02900 [Nitrospiraceae bacterium]
MQNRYQYVKIKGEPKRFFCLQQNPFFLACLLFFSKNTLQPHSDEDGVNKRSLHQMINRLQAYFSSTRTNLLKVGSFVKHKYHFNNSDEMVELPFYGQFCILVNKGHKILDLSRNVAIKVYRSDVDVSTITNELDRLKNGSLFDFAPSIRKWSIEDRWYEEDYISGTLEYSFKPLDTSLLMNKFSRDVIPCLERLIAFRSPVLAPCSEYVNGIKNSLSNGGMLSQVTDGEITRKIWAFIDCISERILVVGKNPVCLVLSHGDFCPANMLNTSHGLRIIDWESATSRSALFDYYSYFFFRPLHQNLSVEECCTEIKLTLPIFLSKLGITVSDVTQILQASDAMYRRLFYLERIAMLIERQKYDTKLNVLGNISKYIDVFNRYEEISSDLVADHVTVN